MRYCNNTHTNTGLSLQLYRALLPQESQSCCRLRQSIFETTTTTTEVPVPGWVGAARRWAQTLVATQKTWQRAATDAPWTSTTWLTTIHNSPGPHRQSCCQAEHIKAICFGRFHFHGGRMSSGSTRNGAKISSSSSLVLLLSDCHVHRCPKEPEPKVKHLLARIQVCGSDETRSTFSLRYSVETHMWWSITIYAFVTCSKLTLTWEKNFKGCTSLCSRLQSHDWCSESNPVAGIHFFFSPKKAIKST